VNTTPLSALQTPRAKVRIIAALVLLLIAVPIADQEHDEYCEQPACAVCLLSLESPDTNATSSDCPRAANTTPVWLKETTPPASITLSHRSRAPPTS
jgi:hypothetical protein